MSSKNDSRRALWKERAAKGFCVYCGNNPHLPERKGCAGCLKTKVSVTLKFIKTHDEVQSESRRLLRKHVIDKYGGKCTCCGEAELLFLTLDHVNNDAGSAARSAARQPPRTRREDRVAV